MRVGAADRDLVALQAQLVFDLLADDSRQVTVDTDQIKRDDNCPMAAGILQG